MKLRLICDLVVWLLMLLSGSQAGLAHPRYRDVQDAAASSVVISERVLSELRKDQIPVAVIKLQEPPFDTAVQAVQSEWRAVPVAVVNESEPVENEVIAAPSDTLKTFVKTAELTEDTVQAAAVTQKKIKEPLLVELEAEKIETQKSLELEQPQQQIASLNDNKEGAVHSQKQLNAQREIAVNGESAAINLQQIKFLPGEVPVALESHLQHQQPQLETVSEQEVVLFEDSSVNVRQATEATSTQTTTQANFVQQIIQNSPLGQFFNQLTGQQAQQQTQTSGQVVHDEPASPAPTIPGFLNPAAAITSAQQAVQTAAQTVVNSTTQAFQGLQQFASNLGNQFQNTLSSLGGQQNQLTTLDSTTLRPPGPLQVIVSNFVGGINNQAGTAGATTTTPSQQQGPLQGLLSFFQGGNRPQNAGAVSAVTAASTTLTSDTGSVEPPKESATTTNRVDDKIGGQTFESEVNNEVRNSQESIDDSFEDTRPEDLIVVNDDEHQRQVAA